jgi:hypothetical protein
MRGCSRRGEGRGKREERRTKNEEGRTKNEEGLFGLFAGVLLFCCWHGIIAAFAPGMAANNAFRCQPAAFDGAVAGDRLQSVLRAGGVKAAARRE